MESFWTTALSLTGLFGVGTFLVYSLYRQWLTLPIFPKLKTDQAYSLFKIFLGLTFAFGALTLAFAAYKAYLDTSTTRREQSSSELGKIIEARHVAGTTKFNELVAAPNLPPEKRAAVQEIRTEYNTLTEQARVANEQGRQVEYHEATKNTVLLLESERAKDAIPQPDRQYLIRNGCGRP